MNNRMWQKIIMFAISLILGIILVTQMRTKNNVLGTVNFDEKAVEMNEELAKLNIEKNRLRDELESLKKENRENEEIYKDT
ncbi:MAG: hypothetical protein PHU60_09610, partial [Tissierellia bacterium]|nr:hypothetical protein [Tissierellia bacterium]